MRKDRIGRLPAWVEPLLLFVVFCTLYVVTLSRSHSFDAVSYALKLGSYLQRGQFGLLLHPHHQLHLPSGLAVYSLLRAASIEVDPLLALQILSAISGAVALALFYLLLRGLDNIGPWAAILTLLLGASKGFWLIATDALPYAAAMVGFMLTLLAMRRCIDSPSSVSAFLLGMATALTATLHHSHMLLFAPSLAAIVLYRQGLSRRLPAWIAGAGLVFAAVYAAVMINLSTVRSVRDLYLWSTKYARLGWWWDFRLGNDLKADAQALTNALVALPSHASTASAYHMPLQNAFTRFAALGLGCLTAACLMAAVIVVARRLDRKAAPLLLGIGCYAAFFTVWCPGFYAFWVPIVVMSLALLAGYGRSALMQTEYMPALGLLLAGVLLLSNATWCAIPRADESTNPYMATVRLIQKSSRPGDLVLLSGTGYSAHCEVYIPYFTGRKTISLNSILNAYRNTDLAMIHVRQQMGRTLARGNTVYILGDMLGSKTSVDPLRRRYGLDMDRIHALFDGIVDPDGLKPANRLIYALTCETGTVPQHTMPNSHLTR